MNLENDSEVAQFLMVVAILKEDALKKGFKKDHPGQSTLECPSQCGGTVTYSVARNGHMMARCSTKDCPVRFME